MSINIFIFTLLILTHVVREKNLFCSYHFLADWFSKIDGWRGRRCSGKIAIRIHHRINQLIWWNKTRSNSKAEISFLYEGCFCKRVEVGVRASRSHRFIGESCYRIYQNKTWKQRNYWSSGFLWWYYLLLHSFSYGKLGILSHHWQTFHWHKSSRGGISGLISRNYWSMNKSWINPEFLRL